MSTEINEIWLNREEVGRLARYLELWRRNPAPWPTDPAESSKLSEKLFTGIDNLIKKGTIKEFGFFMDGNSGYVITEGDSADVFQKVSMFNPYIECEVQEIIPYEKAKGSLRALWKTMAEAAKK
jgi:hypothetical protein